MIGKGRQRHPHLRRPPPWVPQSTSSPTWIPRRIRFHGMPAHWLICQRQSQDSWPDASPMTHRRCAQGGQFSNLLLRSIDASPMTHRRCAQGGTIQQFITEEYRILEVLNYEVTTPMPAAWIEVFERRLSLGQELQLQQPYPPACATRRACR